MSKTEAKPRATSNESMARDLASAVGEVRVRSLPGHSSCLLVRAAEPEDVTSVLEIARHYGAPILQRGPGLQMDELQPPAEPAIVLDLSPMNRTLEINHSERYAVVEPGVTWRALEARLLEDGGDLALPISCSPASVSPWTSCLFDGVEGGGLAIGNTGQLIWGLEAVLPDGETVRIGSRATSCGWWGRGPHPDLSALFRSWRGATGIVTRLSIALTHRKRHYRRLVVPASLRRTAVAAAIRLARTGIFEEAYTVPANLPRMFLGGSGRGSPISGEPDSFLAVDFSGDTFAEIEYKKMRLGQALSRARRRGGTFEDSLPLYSLTRIAPSLDALEDLPVALSMPEIKAANAPGPFARVMSFHGPVSILVDGADAAEDAYSSRRVPAAVLVRPIPGGHHGMVHVALDTRVDLKAEVVLAAELDALYRLTAAGFVPFRFPFSLSDVVQSRLDSKTRDLADRLRLMLDPTGMLDPTRWGLPRPFGSPGRDEWPVACL